MRVLTREFHLQKCFPLASFFCDSQNYSDEQFMSFIKSKLELPFELITDFEAMDSITSPPPRSKFASTLRGTDEISAESYAHFLHVWETLEITNLTELVVIYQIADTTLFADAVVFFFNKLFRKLHLWPRSCSCSSTKKPRFFKTHQSFLKKKNC